MKDHQVGDEGQKKGERERERQEGARRRDAQEPRKKAAAERPAAVHTATVAPGRRRRPSLLEEKRVLAHTNETNNQKKGEDAANHNSEHVKKRRSERGGDRFVCFVCCYVMYLFFFFREGGGGGQSGGDRGCGLWVGAAAEGGCVGGKKKGEGSGEVCAAVLGNDERVEWGHRGEHGDTRDSVEDGAGGGGKREMRSRGCAFWASGAGAEVCAE